MNHSLEKRRGVDSDRVAAAALKVIAAFSVVAILLILFFIAWNSIDAMSDVGPLEFIFGTKWDPANGVYGALPVITGTILVTVGAIAIALPLGLACAIFISEVVRPKYRSILKTFCEVFAGIPSVI